MTVLGTAGSDAGMELVKENGACHTFNHNKEGYINDIRVCIALIVIITVQYIIQELRYCVCELLSSVFF